MPPRKREVKKKPSRPARIRKVKEVIFDEDARKEYLTGFSKRKKQRELAVRTKAIGREKEEARENRKALRDERKERAALNVRNAKELYDADGGDSSSSDDSDTESTGSIDDPADPDGPRKRRHPIPGLPSARTAAYESTELITTVSVEPFSLSRSSSPVAEPRERDGSESPEPGKKGGGGGGGVGEKHKKRVRNKPQYRPKMTKEDKKERAKGGKAKKASFLKGNSGTKARANKG